MFDDFYEYDDFYDEYDDDYANNEDRYIRKDNESILVHLANSHKLKKSKGFKLKKYQKIRLYIYDRSILNTILKEFKFKDCGNIYDYNEFERPEITSWNGIFDYNLFNRLCISKKNNSLAMYNKQEYSINCLFLIDVKYVKKFIKLTSDLIMSDDNNNSLKNENFNCKSHCYLELSDSTKDNTKRFELTQKTILDENLVFDKNSVLDKVKNDVLSFFTEKTENLYKKLQIPFKRGIILYGEPGNGKSSMIREIIRTSSEDISKIVIRRTYNIVNALTSLINGLDGRKAIIIIEDIDSMLNENNRSDFLNVLDGLDLRSGLYFIATTNYPEKLDSAIFNRAGRFDKAYKIGNPTKEARKIFFESRNLYDILKDYDYSKNNKKINKEKLINSFVKYSDNMSMASMKEIITRVSYLLAYNEEKYIKNALINVYNEMSKSNTEHMQMHNEYINNKMIKKGVIREGNNGMIAPMNKISIEKDYDDDIDIKETKNIKTLKIYKI